MKRILLLLPLLFLLGGGCSTSDIDASKVEVYKERNVFVGESENWEGKIIADFTETFTKVDGKWTYDSKNNPGSEGFLRYKGTNLEDIQQLSYKVTQGAQEKSGTKGPASPPYKNIPGGVLPSGKITIGSGIYRSDDVFEVTIKWNDLEETFQMKAVETN